MQICFFSESGLVPAGGAIWRRASRWSSPLSCSQRLRVIPGEWALLTESRSGLSHAMVKNSPGMADLPHALGSRLRGNDGYSGYSGFSSWFSVTVSGFAGAWLSGGRKLSMPIDEFV